MDPPYQGICSGKDPRYYSGIDFDEFLMQLEDLIRRGIPFLLSYDGRKGQKTYGMKLPIEMGLYRVEIRAGRSTQSTLLGRNDTTYESIYISKALLARLNLSPTEIMSGSPSAKMTQLVLPTMDI